MSLLENFRVVISIQNVGDKQTAEKQNFGYEENPDAEFPRIELLFGGVKVMSDKLTVIVVVIVSIGVWIGNCHG